MTSTSSTFRKAYSGLVATAVLLLATVVAPPPGAAQDGPTTVYLAGDSTVASYAPSQYPLTGWGQMLGGYLADDVVVDNRALGGRSSKSFVLEGHLDAILDDIQPGDYLFVQFGHNDRQNTDNLCSVNSVYCNRHTDPYTTFKEYLLRYVDGARAHGATPVLVTPMGRRSFDDDGRFQNDFHDYAAAMKQLSGEHDVPLVDLNTVSIDFYTRIGPPATEEIFLYTEPLEYEAYPQGREDNVHFQEFGADWLARFVAEGVAELGLPLSDSVQVDTIVDNLAEDGAVTASSSSEADGWYGWNVTDGNRTSSVPQALGWSSDDVLSAIDQSEWVQVDLGHALPLTRVVLTPAQAGEGFPRDLTVEVSRDGSEWAAVAQHASPQVPDGAVELTFAPTDGRHVRIAGTRLRQGADLLFRMRLAELEVYSDVVSLTLTGPRELAAGARGAYTAALRIPSPLTAPGGVRFALEVPDASWEVRKAASRTAASTTWYVTAPADGWDGSAVLRATAEYSASGEKVVLADEVAVDWAAPPPPPQPGQHWVSDVPFLEEVNGWGPVERDMANGDVAPGDGGPITIDGVVYGKGLGVHAESSVTIALDGCETFTTVVGLNDGAGDGGSVGFMVEGDGAPLWVHPLVTDSDPGVPAEVDVSGVEVLRLVVNGLGHNGHDHANWAAARLHGCAV